MAKELTQAGDKMRASKPRNAFRDRNWEILFVTFVFLLSLTATIGMILISVFDPQNSDNQFRIIPAASVMLLVEFWLVFSLPFYSKISFWGGVIFLATYLFFAIPFIYYQLLPGLVNLGVGAFVLISLLCGFLLFRQRELFLRPATAPDKERKTH